MAVRMPPGRTAGHPSPRSGTDNEHPDDEHRDNDDHWDADDHWHADEDRDAGDPETVLLDEPRTVLLDRPGNRPRVSRTAADARPGRSGHARTPGATAVREDRDGREGGIRAEHEQGGLGDAAPAAAHRFPAWHTGRGPRQGRAPSNRVRDGRRPRSAGRDTGLNGLDLLDVKRSARRLALTRTAVIAAAAALLAAGPVLGAAALLRGAPAVHVTQQAAAAPAPVTGPAAFALSYVVDWLTAGTDPTSANAPTLATWGPTVEVAATAGLRRVDAAQVSDVQQLGTGTWAVTVQVTVSEYLRGSWVAQLPRWYATSVLVRSSATPPVTAPAAGNRPGPGPSPSPSPSLSAPPVFVATALPHQVPGPAVGKPVAVAAGSEVVLSADSAVPATVIDFLRTYLTGQPVDRLTSPGSTITPVADSGVVAVTVTSLRAPGGTAAALANQVTVPADGTRLHLVAGVDATDAAGPQNPATYALTVVARTGRWEVSSVDPAPALVPTGASPS